MREPVTMVSAMDVAVWCNALSILDNRDPVYRKKNGDIIKKAKEFSSKANVFNQGNIRKFNGYRLPEINEWEIAARYIDGYKWLPENYASGAKLPAWDKNKVWEEVIKNGSNDLDEMIQNKEELDKNFSLLADEDTNSEATKKVSWYRANSNGKTRNVGLLEANAIGIYDMSGNVWEMVLSGEEKAYKACGGAFNSEPVCLLVKGVRTDFYPFARMEYMGFRLAMSYPTD